MPEPTENLYWELSDGTIWKLRPTGSGMYHISNETANSLVAQFRTIEQARELVRYCDLTITEEC